MVEKIYYVLAQVQEKSKLLYYLPTSMAATTYCFGFVLKRDFSKLGLDESLVRWVPLPTDPGLIAESACMHSKNSPPEVSFALLHKTMGMAENRGPLMLLVGAALVAVTNVNR